jgi:mono/diheme cytochrome c family protein
MATWGRRLAKAFAALLLLAAVALLALYLLSQRMLRSDAPMHFTALPKGDPVEGARLAAIAGCTSCHGPDLGGSPFIHIPNVAALVAPDLTRAREKYDDAGLLRVLRSGVKSDGYYAVGMPAFMQQRLTDREAADIIAFVRSVPPAAHPVQGQTRIFPLGRLGVVLGKYPVYAGDPPESAVVLRDRAEPRLGRHLALIACTECHGSHFEGSPEVPAPALAIAKAYSAEQFRQFMRTGITMAGTPSKTGLMTEMTQARFRHFSDAEIADLHAWLTGPDGLR